MNQPVSGNKFKASAIWEDFGITEHLGGIDATERLIELCQITSGQRVLNIGCGTGYTACLLAKRYGVEVGGADISAKVLRQAEARVVPARLRDRVRLLQADAQKLPFAVDVFDVAIAESLLVFCDPQRVCAAVFRTLKRGGVFGANELTYLKLPPAEWIELLSAAYLGLDIHPLLADQWHGILEHAGFSVSRSDSYRINLWEQFRSHVRVDGLRKYLSAVIRGLSDPDIRAMFFNRAMLRGWREYPAYIGYGLYLGKKL
jgi:ubiquinone/menaquinone biosynthesis C-methylase UbiE